MTEGEKIAATTSWKTNRADLSRLIDSAIDAEANRRMAYAYHESVQVVHECESDYQAGDGTHAQMISMIEHEICQKCERVLAAIRQLGGSGK